MSVTPVTCYVLITDCNGTYLVRGGPTGWERKIQLILIFLIEMQPLESETTHGFGVDGVEGEEGGGDGREPGVGG